MEDWNSHTNPKKPPARYHIDLSHTVKIAKCAHVQEIEITSRSQPLAFGYSTYGEVPGDAPKQKARGNHVCDGRHANQFLRKRWYLEVTRVQFVLYELKNKF